MTETPELETPDEPGAPGPKRPEKHVRLEETEVIPPSARRDYLAPDGSATAEDPADQSSRG